MATPSWMPSYSRVTRRRFLGSVSAGAGGAFLLACSGNGKSGDIADRSGLLSPTVDTSRQALRGGTFVGSLSTDPVGFDPHQIGRSDAIHKYLVYSRLVRKKPGYLEPAGDDIVGDLAQSWEFSGDHRQLTLKLQPNARWHNVAPVSGRPVDAQDIVSTWNRFLGSGTSATIFASSRNPEAPIDSLQAVDDRTIVIKTNKVYAALLPLLATSASGNLYIAPREAEDPGKLVLRTRMVGTGAFYQASYEPSLRAVYKRNEQYWDQSRLYIDELQLPIVPEYAQGLAQLRAGRLHSYQTFGAGSSVKAEDVVSLKREQPELRLEQGDVSTTGNMAFFGWNPVYGEKTPFRDQRVRQAFSMSWDRDLWIDVVNNVSAFTDQGIPMETRWNTAVEASQDAYWLNPKGKDFGPNAKYYEHDLEEARKLLTAAGYPNGIDLDAHYPTTGNYGADFNKQVDILIGFAQEAGIRLQTVHSDFGTEWPQKYRDAQGDFDGIAFRLSGASHPDIPEKVYSQFSLNGGVHYTGFFSSDSSFQKGDARMESLLEQTRIEFNAEKRIKLIQDFQRLEAAAQYMPRFPGGSNSFSIYWPTVQNFNVWRGDLNYLGVWIDPTEPPYA